MFQRPDGRIPTLDTMNGEAVIGTCGLPVADRGHCAMPIWHVRGHWLEGHTCNGEGEGGRVPIKSNRSAGF